MRFWACNTRTNPCKRTSNTCKRTSMANTGQGAQQDVSRMASRRRQPPPKSLYEPQQESGLRVQPNSGPRTMRIIRQHRCKPEDACETQGARDNAQVICLPFARGCCTAGKACPALHRLPIEKDEQLLAEHPGLDIFGRQRPPLKLSSWNRVASVDQRTLWVNYEGAGSLSLPDIRKLLEADFVIWGPLESISIKHHLTMAFVTYQYRSSAEFAKEAMDGQKLIGSTQAEVLMVRWSKAGLNQDASHKRSWDDAEQHMQSYESHWDRLTEEQRVMYVADLNMSAALRTKRVVTHYPSTDSQYQDATPPIAGSDVQPIQDATPIQTEDAQGQEVEVSVQGHVPVNCSTLVPPTGYGKPTGYGVRGGYVVALTGSGHDAQAWPAHDGGASTQDAQAAYASGWYGYGYGSYDAYGWGAQEPRDDMPAAEEQQQQQHESDVDGTLGGDDQGKTDSPARHTAPVEQAGEGLALLTGYGSSDEEG